MMSGCRSVISTSGWVAGGRGRESVRPVRVSERAIPMSLVGRPPARAAASRPALPAPAATTEGSLQRYVTTKSRRPSSLQRIGRVRVSMELRHTHVQDVHSAL